MKFMRYDWGSTTMQDMKEFLRDSDLSVVRFNLMDSQVLFTPYMGRTITIGSHTAMTYKRGIGGVIPIEENGSGCVGAGPVLERPEGVSDDEYEVMSFLFHPQNIAVLTDIVEDIEKRSQPYRFAYIVKSWFPSPLPRDMLGDAVTQARKWTRKARKASDAR